MVNPPLAEQKCSWAPVRTHLHPSAWRAQPLRLHAKNIPHRLILWYNGRSVHCGVSGPLPAKCSTPSGVSVKNVPQAQKSYTCPYQELLALNISKRIFQKLSVVVSKGDQETVTLEKEKLLFHPFKLLTFQKQVLPVVVAHTIILALERLRQEDHYEVEVSQQLGLCGKTLFQKKKITKQKQKNTNKI